MKILIVDNDAASLQSMQRALSFRAGYEIETVSTGLEALCRVLIGDIDLVIADGRTPGVDGSFLCESIRKAGLERYVYVVLVTDRTGRGGRMRASFADEVLTRPVVVPELLARVRSIHRLKVLRDRLESRSHELEDMQRFRNEWVDTVVRNIRSRMAAIMGLPTGTSADPSVDQGRFLRHLRYEVGWLDRMLQQMLVVARSEDGKLRPFRLPVDVQRLATEACKAHANLAASKRVRLVVYSPEEDYNAEIDGPLMRGALDNLLSNAIRYAPERSAVVVEVDKREGRIRLAVSDEGPGVSEEALRVLGEAGQNPANAQGEHPPNLGLAYCHAVTVAHSGEIACRPNLPTGARFEMTFPATAPDAQSGLFDPVAFASTLPWDRILPEATADDDDGVAAIEAAVDSRLMLVAGSGASLPC